MSWVVVPGLIVRRCVYFVPSKTSGGVVNIELDYFKLTVFLLYNEVRDVISGQ